MKTSGLLFILVLTLSAAQRQKTTHRADVVLRNEAERTNTRGCSNLTLVLDNWKYAIMTQVKDLLLHDHNTVLPDYGRIQPLSDALGDLYKEFNALKERLADLTVRFDGVEDFVDGVRSGRSPAPPRAENQKTQEAWSRDAPKDRVDRWTRQQEGAPDPSGEPRGGRMMPPKGPREEIRNKDQAGEVRTERRRKREIQERESTTQTQEQLPGVKTPKKKRRWRL
ncbi:unnamed protein product [Pleuronectes platessa]|uniref:Uncharacterized protein n=1 Tax=Pleuronectes platessa TaxID=8262 RepID=A0A9N7YRE3_PLEPL|nr:unnamed protein product [Pleuronectes platessa]